MNQEMLRIIDSIARDRNVDKEALFFDIEQAMVSAARKHFNAEDTDEFTSTVDRLTGEIKIFRSEEEIPLESLGRIPAQTAKQVMIQRFREDERASIYEEFSSRVGELVTGSAQRHEGGNLIVQIGRAEAIMPRSEQIPGEQQQPGERVRCIIMEVRDMGHQVKIIVSRGHEDFIRRLFEVEVPEVSERVIEIRALAREPGHRTKVAVSSIDSKVDAVGACVGVRGSRIKNIVDELAGEKIDVVRWNESSQVLIANALRPAEIVEISLCFELGRATVVVNEDQLSLAIGKRGQNVRLAARLTKWDVDILTPDEFQKGLEIMETSLKEVEGVTEAMIDRIAALGMISVFDIEEIGLEVLPEHLRDVDMTAEFAEKIVDHCSERAKEVAELQQRERDEAERKAASEAAAVVDEAGGSASAEQQAAAILGEMGEPVAAPPSSGGGGGGDIMDMLITRSEDGAEEGASDENSGEGASDEPHDVAISEEVREEAHEAEEEQRAVPADDDEENIAPEVYEEETSAEVVVETAPEPADPNMAGAVEEGSSSDDEKAS